MIRAYVEKLMAILVISVFALTSISIFVVRGGSLTREEAIEISRNSKLVRSLLEGADRYTLEVHYLNKTQVYEDHGVWSIMWYIHPIDAPSAFAYVVSHTINEETGEILSEGSASLR
jgi:hypothetical protein